MALHPYPSEFIPHTPVPPITSLSMSTRRAPLANVPNATNSPLRTTGVVPSKRSRTGSAQLDIPYGQAPPKKQASDEQQQQQQQPGDSKLFTRRSNNGQPSAFERRLYAAREKERPTAARPVRNERPSAETLDSIRQWQRHYRKAFPAFVFYFDSIPEDVRGKCSRQVNALGAREEKFFSRVVTHVVTSRPIPPENSVPSVDQFADGPLQTVNPSLLERHAEMHVHILKNDARREQTTMDVLHRARQMGMKIWALEKLQRMIATINDPDISGHHDMHNTRNNAGGGNARGRGETDLSQVLRNEIINGPSDRDHLSSLKELITFKGPFIYVHDMNEKTRPVMVREYPKVTRRQDGAWPQFRSAPLGKCPFIDEPPTKKELERQRIRQQEREKMTLPKPTVHQDAQPPSHEKTAGQGRAPAQPDDRPKPKNEPEEKVSHPQPPGIRETAPPRPGSPRKSSESFIPPQAPRTGPFYTGREPAASGMQPSNITSAIRSQMVSSTTAAPGAKAGLSKEVHELKRKVLEKGNGLSGAPPHGANPPAWTKPQSEGPRKANPQEKPGTVNEEDNHTGTHGVKRQGSRKNSNPKKERPRDPKPGYCENCRDKFDDFETHTQTRKHRRFALTTANWVELDDLLQELERPIKAEYAHLHHI